MLLIDNLLCQFIYLLLWQFINVKKAVHLDVEQQQEGGTRYTRSSSSTCYWMTTAAYRYDNIYSYVCHTKDAGVCSCSTRYHRNYFIYFIIYDIICTIISNHPLAASEAKILP